MTRWVEANVAPVFKKGDRHSPANYRPISLTCVYAKLLEHIICKQIMSHFSKNKILTPVQHCFRSKHSCESQLLITTDVNLTAINSRDFIDVNCMSMTGESEGSWAVRQVQWPFIYCQIVLPTGMFIVI